MIKKILITSLVLIVSLNSYASAYYTITDTQLDSNNKTLVKCLNSKGFFYVIGKSNTKSVPFRVRGFQQRIPLYSAIRNSLKPGWRMVFDKSIDKSIKITQTKNEEWTQWLQKVAFDNNLAIIVNWDNQTVYISRI